MFSKMGNGMQLGVIIGSVSERVGTNNLDNLEIILRHGPGHIYPPHLVPYKSHVQTLKASGVTDVIAVSTVGSLSESVKPRTFCIPDQLLDFTKCRESTFSSTGNVVHPFMWEPFNASLRDMLVTILRRLDCPVTVGGTYVCIEGPRFSTKAESRMFASLGGTIIGMTACPEAYLAREAGLEYALLCCVTDYDGSTNFEGIRQASKTFGSQIGDILTELNRQE